MAIHRGGSFHILLRILKETPASFYLSGRAPRRAAKFRQFNRLIRGKTPRTKKARASLQPVPADAHDAEPHTRLYGSPCPRPVRGARHERRQDVRPCAPRGDIPRGERPCGKQPPDGAVIRSFQFCGRFLTRAFSICAILKKGFAPAAFSGARFKESRNSGSRNFSKRASDGARRSTLFNTRL